MKSVRGDINQAASLQLSVLKALDGTFPRPSKSVANLSPSQWLRLQKAPQSWHRNNASAFFHSCVDGTNTSKLTSRSLTDDSCWECWGRLHSGLLARPACGTADLMCRSVTGWGAKDKVQVHADHMTAESLQSFSPEEGGVPLSPNRSFPVGVCRPTPPS